MGCYNCTVIIIFDHAGPSVSNHNTTYLPVNYTNMKAVTHERFLLMINLMFIFSITGLIILFVKGIKTVKYAH